ncbi:MAG TPA: dephospho-CoA kinase [Ignavibacteria bacterium]|nr:dephospho-CoA kinase [Ignavibacteria bacterium]HRF66515.1 dephospho-CoA kinase [Ignavibacteria bacterium]HRJ03595.1 dephospho-CoA kinase [Ignavibacteria bacterium]
MSRSQRLKIGITGGIGSGKSLACRYLEEMGYKVIYADRIAKDLYASNKTLLKKLARTFGSEILNADGSLNRSNARKIIFSNKRNIKRVNSIVHPFVFAETDRIVSKIKSRVLFFEAAIMFESGSYKGMDHVVLIYANKETRIKRIISRDGVRRADVLRLMKMQLDERQKLKRADFVIKNNSKPNDLKKSIKAFSKIIDKL